MLIQEQFKELEAHVSEYFDKRIKAKPDYRSQLFNMQNSNRSVEEHLGFGSTQLMTTWTGQVNYGDFQKGYQTNYRHTKYSAGMQVERELLDFENFAEIKRRIDALLVNSVYQTQQIHAASVFNNAFDDSYAGADAVGLCSAAHPLSPTESATQSNEGTAALTVGSIDSARQSMINFTDDKENILVRDPNCIIVGPKQWKNAKKLIGSALEPENANNGINVFGSGELKMIYNPYITVNGWFLADEMVMKEMLNWYTARQPSVEMENVFDTEVAKYKTVGLWSKGWDDYSFIYGNKIS